MNNTPSNPSNNNPNSQYNNRRPSRPDNRNPNQNRDNFRKPYSNNRPKKSLVLLKSAVLGLFLILIALVVVFALVKSKKIELGGAKTKCSNSVISLENQIEKVDFIDNSIVIVTNTGANSKEVIRFDSKCGKEINRIKISVK